MRIHEIIGAAGLGTMLGEAVNDAMVNLEANASTDDPTSKYVDVTEYLGDGCIGFLLPNGKAIDVVSGSRTEHRNWSHRLAAQFIGSNVTELAWAGVARVYATPGEDGVLEIAAEKRPTSAQISTLAKAVSRGGFRVFRVFGGRNKSFKVESGWFSPKMVQNAIDVNWPAHSGHHESFRRMG